MSEPSKGPIPLTINGEPRQLGTEQTVLQFLQEREIHPQYVVVEHNGAVLPREQYGDTLLRAGDVVEIVHMMGGG